MPTAVKLIPLVSAVIATAAVFYVYGVFSVQHTNYGTLAVLLAPYRFLSYK